MKHRWNLPVALSLLAAGDALAATITTETFARVGTSVAPVVVELVKAVIAVADDQDFLREMRVIEGPPPMA